MRIVMIGGSRLAETTAELFIAQRHQVTIIERDKDRMDALGERLDCGLLLGDGSSPDLLREADPDHTDILYCLTDHDQTNIIAGLAARNLGFPRVICLLEEAGYEPLCAQLGLDEIVNPMRSISLRLIDLAEHAGAPNPDETVKHDAMLYSRQIKTDLPSDQLDLPESARFIGYYRDDKLAFPGSDTVLKPGDEILILARDSALEQLERLFT